MEDRVSKLFDSVPRIDDGTVARMLQQEVRPGGLVLLRRAHYEPFRGCLRNCVVCGTVCEALFFRQCFSAFYIAAR